VADPIGALRNMHRALQEGGRLILCVPQGQGLYSSLDRVLGHRCRYSSEQLRHELAASGFVVERLVPFNHLVPIVRRVDRFLPWLALGLIAVARAGGAASAG
jgi:hypothetical protein